MQRDAKIITARRFAPFDPAVLQKLSEGDAPTLVMAVASYGAALLAQAGFPAGARVYATDLVERSPVQAGKAASALDLLRLLSHAPQGRQALRDLGLQPFLHHVEGE